MKGKQDLGVLSEKSNSYADRRLDSQARDLAPDLRRAAEALLGRLLQEDESISVRVFKGDIAKQAPAGEARAEAFRRLRTRIEQTAKPAQGVPEAEIDAAIDEAVDYVRHHRG